MYLWRTKCSLVLKNVTVNRLDICDTAYDTLIVSLVVDCCIGQR